MPENAWIDQMFSAQCVREGGLIRRSIYWVHKIASYELLIREVRRRGFRLVEVGNQYVVLCNTGDIS